MCFERLEATNPPHPGGVFLFKKAPRGLFFFKTRPEIFFFESFPALILSSGRTIWAVNARALLDAPAERACAPCLTHQQNARALHGK